MSTFFHNGSKINISQLQDLGNTTNTQINLTKSISHKYGVIFLPASVSNNFAFTRYTTGTVAAEDLYMNVGYITSGSANAAYGGYAIDSSGRDIIISANQTYLFNTSTRLFDETYLALIPPSGETLAHWYPTRTDDQDLSLTTGTNTNPNSDGKYLRNSGNTMIPVNIGVNYVYIKYIEIVKKTATTTQIDPSDSTQYETYFVPGYCIEVINPDYITGDDYTASTFQAYMTSQGFILLGTETVLAPGDPEGILTDYTFIPSYTTTEYGYLQGSAVGSLFNPTGVTYPTDGQHYIDVATHINAVGSGVTSSTNPHGLAIGDLGININDIGTPTAVTLTENLDLSSSTITPASYRYLAVDATEGNITITLPAASSDTAQLLYTIKRVDTSETYTVTVTTGYNGTTRTDLLDGLTTAHTLTSKQFITVMPAQRSTSSDYDWWIIQ